MINYLKSLVNRNILNAKGWKTDRKILVIESDDWGSIRMPNKNTYNDLIELGFKIENNPYCKYDTLADVVDLTLLYEVLSKFRDSKNNAPIITFNTVVANPDFNKIRESDFINYHYEPFSETLGNYYPNQNVFGLWKEGIELKLIQPQFHGREHVNAPLWLQELRNNNEVLIKAFEMGCWGVPRILYGTHVYNIQAAFFSNTLEEMNFSKQNIIEGLYLFERLFGFRAETFIANNYTFPLELLTTLKESGIDGIQSMKYHKIPNKNNSFDLKRVYTGKKTVDNQIYTLRNCLFEPSQKRESFDNIGNCLKDVNNAFAWSKPAIISTHRLNFIGSIDESNRSKNLIMFKELLGQILKRWPDVEFMSSDQLVRLIINE